MSDIETIEQTLAYQLGRQAAIQEIMQALQSRAFNHTNPAKVSECLLINHDILKPLWLDAGREATGLHVAGLEHKA